MTPRKTGVFLVLIVSSLLMLTTEGCRTWIPRKSMALMAYNDANSYRESGKYEEALTAYRSALKHNPHMTVAVYNLALTLVDMDRSNEALELFQTLKQHDPGNLKILRAMAWASWNNGKVQDSLDYYSSVLSLSPGDKVALRGSCEVLEASSRAGEAVEMRKMLLRLDDNTQSRLDLANTFVLAENHAEALENFRIIILDNPGDKKALSSAAISAENMGQFRESINYLQLLANETEENGDIWWHIAELSLERLENYKTGIKAVEKALKQGFKDEEAFDSLINNSSSFIRGNLEKILIEKSIDQLKNSPEEEQTEKK